MMRQGKGFLVLAGAAALAACASPDPKRFTLAATDGASLPAAGTVMEIHHVDVPDYLDRPEIVRRSGDYRVMLVQNERWSEPFGAMVQQTLREDLGRRLAGAVVLTDASALSAATTVTVELDISQLDADAGGQAVLDAQFSVIGPAPSEGTAPTLTKHLRLTADAGKDSSSYAAALSTLTGELADAIAAAASELRQDQSAQDIHS